jgi:hypothetical protein
LANNVARFSAPPATSRRTSVPETTVPTSCRWNPRPARGCHGPWSRLTKPTKSVSSMLLDLSSATGYARELGPGLASCAHPEAHPWRSGRVRPRGLTRDSREELTRWRACGTRAKLALSSSTFATSPSTSGRTTLPR